MRMDRKNDFLHLIEPYTSPEQRQMFLDGYDKNPVSGIIVKKEPTSIDGIIKDKNDDLLYRFDKEEARLGKSIQHFAGDFYILDPSSATISYYLQNLLPDDFLSIDLCGAPGGKTIAMALRKKDALYLCNDISFQRANEIVKNTERLGLSNILTLSIDPMKLNMDSLFDLVILDVPCSGSGMFRKEKKMEGDWSMEKVERLLPIQENLLKKAYELLSKDGILCYSTCSFSVEEDEKQVKKFLEEHSDMELIGIDVEKGILKGVDNIGYHMIPGVFSGEGIYFAIMRKTDGHKTMKTSVNLQYSKKASTNTLKYKNNEYAVPRFYKEIQNLPYLSCGTKIFDTSEHPKCEYDHAFSKVVENIPTIELNEDKAKEYILGNEIKIDSTAKDGLIVLTYNQSRLGFGKKIGQRVKNYLPKGLREKVI